MIVNKKIRHEKHTLDISYVTDKGGRLVNEDSLAVEQSANGILLAIADGLGGHGGGDIASKTAIETAIRSYTCTTGKINNKTIYKIFDWINEDVLYCQTEEVKMKTTMACMFLKNKYMYVSHIGDTRIYIFRKDKITEITADHTYAYDDTVKKGGTLDDLRINLNRHILKAALGVSGMREPDTFRKKIRKGSSVLICSDGFWEYVNEADMLESYINSENAVEWLQNMMKRYKEKSAEYSDNYSAICLKIL